MNICYSNNIRILFEYRIIRSPLLHNIFLLLLLLTTLQKQFYFFYFRQNFKTQFFYLKPFYDTHICCSYSFTISTSVRSNSSSFSLSTIQINSYLSMSTISTYTTCTTYTLEETCFPSVRPDRRHQLDLLQMTSVGGFKSGGRPNASGVTMQLHPEKEIFDTLLSIFLPSWPIFWLFKASQSLNDCPAQPTCFTHFDLCICVS